MKSWIGKTFLILSIAYTGKQAFSKVTWQDAPARTNVAQRSIDIDSLNHTFISVAENASPAVVLIETSTTIGPRNMRRGGGGRGDDPEEFFRHFFNPFGGGMPTQPQEARSLGSGFVINAEEGLIVTNAHVIKMNNSYVDDIKVKFIQENSKGYDVEIIERRYRSCCIKIKKET